MDIVAGVILGLFVMTLLVVFHEAGHFIMARRSGVHIKEFGIGFPPRAIAWQKGKDGHWHRYHKADWDTEWNFTEDSKKLIEPGLIFSINWLPIGGFCSMSGESDADSKRGTFGASTFWQKTKILFGGVLMNWLVAIIIFTVLALTGLPEVMPSQFHLENDTIKETHPIHVSSVIEDSPAERAGFKENDLIYSVKSDTGDPTEITSSNDLSAFNLAHAGEQVTYTVKNGDTERELTAILNDKDAEYQLGVTMNSTGQTLYRSTWSAPLVGVVTTAQLTGETFRSLGLMLGDLFSGIFRQFSADQTVREEGQAAIRTAGDSVTGPVGILGSLFPAYVSAGPTNIAFLSAIISVSLACMNVLPIPALDGGRWLLIAFSRLRRKKLSTETENRIVSRAFLILLALALLITILDVMRIVR